MGDKNDSTSQEMSFWGHLDVFRGVLFRIVALTLAFAIIFFIAMHWLFDNVILAPCNNSFPLYHFFDYALSLFSGSDSITTTSFSVNLINIKLASQFFIHISTSCWLAIICAFPFIIYQLWGFISPALYEHEKRGARPAFFFGIIMFFLGLAVGYFLVFPLTLRFLADYKLSETIANTISLESYMDNFFTIIFTMGLVFELPLLAWLLGKMGFLYRQFFSRYRRHAIVILLILAAMITPTGDPFTLLIVFIPLYFLWEFSSRLVSPKVELNEDDD